MSNILNVRLLYWFCCVFFFRYFTRKCWYWCRIGTMFFIWTISTLLEAITCIITTYTSAIFALELNSWTPLMQNINMNYILCRYLRFFKPQSTYMTVSHKSSVSSDPSLQSLIPLQVFETSTHWPDPHPYSVTLFWIKVNV